MQNENLRNFLEDEFINWQIKNAAFKLDTLKDPFKIPHAQHWIMQESLYKIPLYHSINGTRPKKEFE